MAGAGRFFLLPTGWDASWAAVHSRAVSELGLQGSTELGSSSCLLVGRLQHLISCVQRACCATPSMHYSQMHLHLALSVCDRRVWSSRDLETARSTHRALPINEAVVQGSGPVNIIRACESCYRKLHDSTLAVREAKNPNPSCLPSCHHSICLG